MAQWTQTLEPYIRVHEEVKTMALNPTAGEDLIIGVTFISDAGPSTPTLIRNQKEFLATYTSQDLTQEYIESLNQLYTGDDKTLAANMWANAYRLAGSNTILAVRACKANGMYYAKPLVPGDHNEYILRDGELLKKVSPFKIVLDEPADYADHDSDGWNININGVGIFGNRTTDDGAQYDYFVNDLPSLVDNLNDTSKFFSPSYSFYSQAEQEQKNEILDIEQAKTDAKVVVFHEVYLGHNILDKTDPRTEGLVTDNSGSDSDTPTPTYKYYYTNGRSSERPHMWVLIDDPTTEIENNVSLTISVNPNSALNPSYYADDTIVLVVTTESTAPQPEYIYYMFRGNAIRPSWEITTNTVLDAALLPEIYDTVGDLPTDSNNIAIGSVARVRKYTSVDVEHMSDRSDTNTTSNSNRGLLYMIVCQPDWKETNPPQQTLDLNDSSLSGFNASEYYATNVYNSATQLGVRIRRFNHDAVVTKELTSAEKATLLRGSSGKSPYKVLKNVLDTYTKGGIQEPAEGILKRDFFEIAIFDPSVNGEVSFFNIGNILGRGDMEVSEVNELIKMIQLNLPDDLHDLGLNYFDYVKDDYTWEKTNELNTLRWAEVIDADPNQVVRTFNSLEEMYKFNATAHGLASGKIVETRDSSFGESDPTKYYRYTAENTISNLSELETLTDIAEDTIYTYETTDSYEQTNYMYVLNGSDELYADLTIKTSGDDASAILNVSDSDFKKAMDQILEDEVYTTEGLSDLGNTEPSFQTYLANMAISETGNYFYPVSTVNSTNYMTIGNSATKISQDSYKLYMSAPWDVDTGTLGWKFYASPSVLYWESVARNRRNNNEFASILGQTYGLMQYQRPVTEFNKKTRQLLLSRRVNTVMWNVATQAWNMNDCYTKQNENNIMGEDGNSRLMIRISKAMPVILRQFIGRKITEPMCKEVVGVIDYFFRTTIIPMNITVDGYQIFCDYDEALARQNKIKVVINCRYSRSLKYIEVYNRAFDVGMDISNPN